MTAQNKLCLLTGNSNPKLAEEIAEILGQPLGNCVVKRFADGEVSVSLLESVRDKDVFIIEPTCKPVNDSLMELCTIMDAVKRSSAARINAVIPYFGYARQDRQAKPREPITARLVADLITAAGAQRVITMDLHAAQIQGYFNIPVDLLKGGPLLIKYMKTKNIPDLTVVAPDHGSVSKAREFATAFGAPIAIIDKRRPKPNVSEIVNVIGTVEGRNCILIDDMIDTAGTICNAADALMELKAKAVYACATHGVLSGPAIERIQNCAIKEMILLNTIPLTEEKRIDKITQLSTAGLFAETIRRVHEGEPLSPLLTVQ